MKQKLGIIDWGIGGMGVYSALRTLGKTTDVVYFSDSGSTPYGKMTEAELRERFTVIGKFLKEQDCSEVLVACNAASSAIFGETEMFGGLKFHSIIPAAVRMALRDSANHIGVIGGLRTIESGVYQKLLSGMNCSFTPAQPLSALVEAGNLSGETVEGEISKVLKQIPEADALLLACTHYPALNAVFKKLAPHLDLIDPADEMIQSRNLEAGSSALEFFTTGDVNLSIQAADRAFGIFIKAGAKV